MEAVLREIEAERAKRATLVLLIEKKRELAQLKRDNRQMEEELQRAPSCSASDSLAASAAAGGHAKRARAGPPGTEPQAASPAPVGAGGFLCLDPGRKKRVTVCAFKSKILLHVREHFQDGDGAWQPGKKGVTLALLEWHLLKKHAALLSSHLSRGEAFELDLGRKRVASVKSYNGKHYVDVREHYHADKGESKPTRKGIMLAAEPWQNLVSNFAAADALIDDLEES